MTGEGMYMCGWRTLVKKGARHIRAERKGRRLKRKDGKEEDGGVEAVKWAERGGGGDREKRQEGEGRRGSQRVDRGGALACRLSSGLPHATIGQLLLLPFLPPLIMSLPPPKTCFNFTHWLFWLSLCLHLDSSVEH